MSENKALNFFYRKEQEEKSQEQQGTATSRISNQLVKAVQYQREPTFFDTEEVTERDKKLLQELKAADEKLKLRRNNKPVFLQNAEAKLLFALAYIIGLDTGKEDIQRVIADPFAKEAEVVRIINIADVSKLMNNGSSRKRERDTIRELLLKLHSTFQITPLTAIDPQTGKERKLRHTAPLIIIEDSIEELSGEEEENNIDLIKIKFGRAFFINLNTRFAILPRRLFEVWSKKKGGELFHVLLSSLLLAYPRCYTAAIKTKERNLLENKLKDKNLRLSSQELREKIKAQQAEAWKFELTYSSIKEKVARDYSSKRIYKHLFKNDLNDVIEAFKELGLITDAKITAEGRIDPKVTFVLSERYHEQRKEEREKLEAPAPDEEKSPEDSGT